MSIVYAFRIVIDASDRFTVDTLSLPSLVNNVLSLDSLSLVFRIFRSVTINSLVGSCPSATPETVVTPTTDTLSLLIETILDKIGSCEADRSLY